MVAGAQERVLGPDHLDTVGTVEGCAVLHLRMHQPEKADPLLRRVVDVRARVLGKTNVATRKAARTLATAIREEGRPEDAAKSYAEQLRLALGCDSCDDRETMELRSAYGACLADLGRFAEAEEQLVGALDFAVRTVGRDDPLSADASRRLDEMRERRTKGAAPDLTGGAGKGDGGA